MSEYTLYNEKVMDHFMNPRNMGDIKDADGIGEVGAAACGDIMKMSIKVDENTHTITDVKFKTFGCGSAIAASSMATELIIGKTLDELENFTNEDVLNGLGGVEEWKLKMPQKIHCSVLAEAALQEALADYKRRKNIK
jgi:nitrogen fixation NifU-like protein